MPRLPLSTPVLMYHKVGHPVTCPQDTFINVSEESFRRQMRLMTRLGYRARTFGEIIEARISGRTLPRRTFAITFDDGYRGVGEVAVPILAQMGLPATVFVVSNYVGKTNAWDRELGYPEVPLMDWVELRRLAAMGWEIGGHTRSHRHLGFLDDEAASREIREGKEETENHTGQTLQTFCYPFGRFNNRTPGLVRAAGFHGACTMRSGLHGSNSDPFLYPRVKVYGEGVAGLVFRVFIRPYLPTRQRRHSWSTPAI